MTASATLENYTTLTDVTPKYDQSSHSQEIFYVYITLQAYHDEEDNPTPTHEGRTVVY